MTNETTASQPKSIGADAQFLQVLRDWHHSNQPFADMEFNKLIDYLNSRAPAAQASATIQAAPTFECSTCHGAGWVPRDPDIGTEQECFSCGGSGEDEEAALIAQAATIQEPVMVAEPVKQAQTSVAVAKVYVQDNGRAGVVWLRGFKPVAGMGLYAAQLADSTGLAAPMVADPAGVTPEMIQWRNIRKVVTAVADFCFGSKDDPVYGASHCAVTTCLTAKDGVQVLLEPLAATVKAVPSEAVDAGPFTLEQRMPPKGEEVLIYFAGSNGKMECRIDEWDDLHEDPIGMGGPTICVGEGWVSYYEDNVTHWAPIPAVNFAAPLADKTGGGE